LREILSVPPSVKYTCSGSEAYMYRKIAIVASNDRNQTALNILIIIFYKSDAR